ncbi:MAG: PHP domain-containing protein [bacterium]|nr:PHP domain-containing protein [bacterium]
MLIRADFHIHSSDDPLDNLPHSAEDIVRRAATCGIHCLAITNHLRFTWPPDAAALAQQLGVLLIPAIEVRIEHADVIILNADPHAETLRTFADLRSYRAPHRCVIAPHPFYPLTHSVHHALEQYHDLFDAVELSPFFLPWFDGFNARARRVAQRYGLPLVCNTDAHNLWQLGTSWTELDVAELSVTAVIDAIRAGRCRPVCRRVPLWRIAWFWLCGTVRWRLREARQWYQRVCQK